MAQTTWFIKAKTVEHSRSYVYCSSETDSKSASSFSGANTRAIRKAMITAMGSSPQTDQTRDRPSFHHRSNTTESIRAFRGIVQVLPVTQVRRGAFAIHLNI